MFSGNKSLEAPTKQYVRGPVSGPSNTTEEGIFESFEHKQPQKWRRKKNNVAHQSKNGETVQAASSIKGLVVPKKSQVRYALYLHFVGTKIHQSQATKPTPPNLPIGGTVPHPNPSAFRNKWGKPPVQLHLHAPCSEKNN